MTLEDALSRSTISVPDAGKLFFGLSKNSAYEAARNGDMPTIRVGRRVVVPVAPLAEKVGLRMKVGGAN